MFSSVNGYPGRIHINYTDYFTLISNQGWSLTMPIVKQPMTACPWIMEKQQDTEARLAMMTWRCPFSVWSKGYRRYLPTGYTVKCLIIIGTFCVTFLAWSLEWYWRCIQFPLDVWWENCNYYSVFIKNDITLYAFIYYFLFYSYIVDSIHFAGFS